MTTIQPGGAAGLPAIKFEPKVGDVSDVLPPADPVTGLPPAPAGDTASVRHVPGPDGQNVACEPVKVEDGDGLIATAKKYYGHEPTKAELDAVKAANPDIKGPHYVVPKGATLNMPMPQEKVDAQLDALMGGALAGAGAGAAAAATRAIADRQAAAEADRAVSQDVKDTLDPTTMWIGEHLQQTKDGLYQAKTTADFQAVLDHLKKYEGKAEVDMWRGPIEKVVGITNPAVRESAAQAVADAMGGEPTTQVDAELRKAYDACTTPAERAAVRAVADELRKIDSRIAVLPADQ